MEAWSEIYREFHPDATEALVSDFFCGPRNDDIISAIAPDLTDEERKECSIHKEALYRNICKRNPDKLHLAAGAEKLFQYLKDEKIPFILASASIADNINFYFEAFDLGRWFDRDICVYDDGTYEDKGQMHIEAARRLGASISECIVIEDSTYAISLVKKYGAGKIIGVGSESNHPELFRAGADHCIRDFTEFNYDWLKI